MPTPLRLKSPTAAWIVTERRRLGLKPRDVAVRMNGLGYPDVSEATVKVWESNGNRRPSPYNLEGLERLFESRAPDLAAASGDQMALVAALRDQTAAIKDLVEMIAVWVRADVAGLRPARDLGFDPSPDAIEDRLAWMEQSLRERRESEADQERSAPPERVG